MQKHWKSTSGHYFQLIGNDTLVHVFVGELDCMERACINNLPVDRLEGHLIKFNAVECTYDEYLDHLTKACGLVGMAT